MTARYHVEALCRGLAILDCFVQGPPRQTVSEISVRLGLNKATAFRLIQSLIEAGYVNQDPASKRYGLSLKALDLSDAAIGALEFPRLAQSALEALNARLGESCNLGVLEGTELRYVARVHSRRLMRIELTVGSRLPAHATSLGKVLLADLEPNELAELYADQELTAYTPRTITSLDALRACLREVAAQGFALNYEELELGLCSVAAPVYGRDGRVIAGVSAATFASRATPEQLRGDFAPPVVATAADISRLLGYRPDRPRQLGAASRSSLVRF